MSDFYHNTTKFFFAVTVAAVATVGIRRKKGEKNIVQDEKETPRINT